MADATIFIQLPNGTIQSIPCNFVNGDPSKVVLLSPPAIPLVFGDDIPVKPTFQLEKSPTGPTRTKPFMVLEKDPKSTYTTTVRAANYNDSFYTNDDDSPEEDTWPWSGFDLVNKPPLVTGWTKYYTTNPLWGIGWTGDRWIVGSSETSSPYAAYLESFTTDPEARTTVVTDVNGASWFGGAWAQNENHIVIGSGWGIHFFVSHDRGATWTYKEGPSNNFGVRSIAYGNGLFVACANDGRLFISSDNGETWSGWSAYQGVSNGFSTRNVLEILWDGSTWIATTDLRGYTSGVASPRTGRIYTNPDPTNVNGWVIAYEMTDIGIGSSDYQGKGLAFDGTNYVVLGHSYDGHSSIHHATSPSGPWSTDITVQYNSPFELAESLSYGNGMFIVPTSWSSIVVSTDGGATWQYQNNIGAGQNGPDGHDDDMEIRSMVWSEEERCWIGYGYYMYTNPPNGVLIKGNPVIE